MHSICLQPFPHCTPKLLENPARVEKFCALRLPLCHVVGNEVIKGQLWGRGGGARCRSDPLLKQEGNELYSYTDIVAVLTCTPIILT